MNINPPDKLRNNAGPHNGPAEHKSAEGESPFSQYGPCHDWDGEHSEPAKLISTKLWIGRPEQRGAGPRDPCHQKYGEWAAKNASPRIVHVADGCSKHAPPNQPAKEHILGPWNGAKRQGESPQHKENGVDSVTEWVGLGSKFNGIGAAGD